MQRREFLTGAGAATGALATCSLTANALESSPKAAKFKLGIVTYNIARDWDLPTIIKVCKDTGMDAVELRSTHKHGVEPTLSKQKRKDVKKMFADGGVKIYGCGSACEYHSASPDVVRKNVELTKRFAELVADVGAIGVKVRPNGFTKGVPEDKTLQQIGKALIECGKSAKDHGVEIHVEVHGRGTAHPPHVATMMKHCDHPSVGVTWNCNPTDLKNGSVAEYFKLLWPWIRNCHVHELYHDDAGKYPYREFLRLLRDNGYDRWTLIEMGRVPQDLSARIEVLRYYKALWRALT